MAKASTSASAPAKPVRQRTKKTAPAVYTVVVTLDKDGHWVGCAPALESCGSCGHSLAEALQMTEEALRLYLDGRRELGWPVAPDNPQVCVDMSEATEAYVCRLTIREIQPRA